MKQQHTSESKGGKQRAISTPLRLSLLLLSGIFIWAGCKDTSNGGGTNVTGNYVLESVDGQKVPCTVQHEGNAVAIKSGAFSVKPDRTCNSKVVFSLPSGSETTREVKATYTLEGRELKMKWEGAGTTSGTVEGNTFTMNNEGMIFTYRK